jgi:hypothetical protein
VRVWLMNDPVESVPCIPCFVGFGQPCIDVGCVSVLAVKISAVG